MIRIGSSLAAEIAANPSGQSLQAQNLPTYFAVPKHVVSSALVATSVPNASKSTSATARGNPRCPRPGTPRFLH